MVCMPQVEYTQIKYLNTSIYFRIPKYCKTITSFIFELQKDSLFYEQCRCERYSWNFDKQRIRFIRQAQRFLNHRPKSHRYVTSDKNLSTQLMLTKCSGTRRQLPPRSSSFKLFWDTNNGTSQQLFKRSKKILYPHRDRIIHQHVINPHIPHLHKSHQNSS